MTSTTPVSEKSLLRKQILTQRRHRDPQIIHDESHQILTHLLCWVSQLCPPVTVCAYLPLPHEPGTPQILDRLLDYHVRVLLPVISDPSSQPTALCWAPYQPGHLSPGPYGILQPDTARLGPQALSQAQAMILPALAVDYHGNRLGRGKGYYDRSLSRYRPTGPRCALIGDHEFVPTLPHDPHDIPVTEVITPTRGLIRIPVCLSAAKQ